jgi:hypothetical protein
MKRVLITGATGLIGRQIVNALISRGDDVIVLTTNADRAKKVLPSVKHFFHSDNYLLLKDEKIDAVINLAGMNLGIKRWNDDVKKQLYDSRINTTAKISELISIMKNKPKVLVSASGVDYYGSRGVDYMFEESGHGDDFISKLCVDWENEAKKAEKVGARVVTIRTGFVLAKDSKAVEKLVKPFKLFIGVYPGSGNQYMSWIHIDDLVGIYLYAIDNPDVKGAINAAAPEPVPMKRFCCEIKQILNRSVILPIPEFLVLLVAGEVGKLVLNGRRAVPDKIIKLGYSFKYERVHEAWKDILTRTQS